MRTGSRLALGVAALFGIAAPSAAQPPAAAQHDVTALAKETQNPAGDLISVPLQFNFDTGGGLGAATLLNVNLQPVMPFRVSEGWKVITRTIVPINSYPGPDGMRFSGLGDIQVELFIAPAGKRKWTVGVGPLFSLPTATAAPASTGTWGAGIAGVVSGHAGPFVFGTLVTRTWTIADAGGDPDVDAFLVQPFVNWNFGPGWALSAGPSIAANFNAADGDEWTVPLGLGITRTVVFDRRPMTLGAYYYYNVERPDSGPGQQIRLSVSLLFPGGR